MSFPRLFLYMVVFNGTSGTSGISGIEMNFFTEVPGMAKVADLATGQGRIATVLRRISCRRTKA